MTPPDTAAKDDAFDRLFKAAARVWATVGHAEWCPYSTEGCECGYSELSGALEEAKSHAR